MRDVKTNIFKYWGGKYKIVDWVISHFPDNYQNLTYIEPFCGSAIILLNKIKSKVEIISDLDKSLFCLHRAIRERPDDLVKLLENTMYSTNELNHALDIIDGVVELDDWIHMAWAKYVSLKCSFFGNGSRNALKISSLNNNECSAFRSGYARIDEVVKRMRYVNVLNKDALKVIEQFDSEDSFFYLDPPYPETDQSGYKNCYTMDDFNMLTEALKKIKGKYLISFELKDGMECKDNIGDRHLFTKNLIRASRIGINNCDNKHAVECLMSNYMPSSAKQLTLDLY